MREKTKKEYLSIADNFYRTRLQGKIPTPKRIIDELKICAADYQPNYWRRLRVAIAYDQENKGYRRAAERIRQQKQPLCPSGHSPRKRRTKRVSESETEKLLMDCLRRGDLESWAAISLTRRTGIRPAEMPGARLRGDQLEIVGVKKTGDGMRGADRTLLIDSTVLDEVKRAVDILSNSSNVGRIQERVRKAGRRLWPQRKSVPSLYSWRHQLGSSLKGSHFSRAQIAYVMGHQSSRSVERYGNRKNAGAVWVSPGSVACLEKVRQNHRLPPSAKHTKSPSKNCDAGQSMLSNSFEFSRPGPRIRRNRIFNRVP